MRPVSKWRREEPKHTGWYWLTVDPDKEPLGVFMYTENSNNYISQIIKIHPDKYFISGPIAEPKNDPI